MPIKKEGSAKYIRKELRVSPFIDKQIKKLLNTGDFTSEADVFRVAVLNLAKEYEVSKDEIISEKEVDDIIEAYEELDIRRDDIELIVEEFYRSLAIFVNKITKVYSGEVVISEDLKQHLIKLEAASLILRNYSIFFGLQTLKPILFGRGGWIKTDEGIID